MCFSINPHSISIHSRCHTSSLTLSTPCHSSLSSFLHFLSFPIDFIILTLSTLLSYSCLHSNHIPCLLSSSHLHHTHHLTYSSIIHPASFSFHPPSIPSFSHFSLYHSSISPWWSSRFPQNSFSPISFSKPFYSLFHPPFPPISSSSPSSPLISAIHSHSHLCSLYIHFHPFPSHSSSQPLRSHSLLSITIPILPFHSILSFSFICYFSIDSSSLMFSGILTLHYPSLSFISSIPILIYLSSILHIPFISFLRYLSTCLYFEINTMFVFILLVALSFVVLIGNTLSQLDVFAFVSDS